MESALGLAKARPSSGASIFSGINRARAMCATDAGVIAVMERVVRNIILHHITPHHFASPISQRADLHQTEFRVPIYFANRSALSGLSAANRGDPGIKRRQLPPQWLDLADGAALVGIVCP